MNKAQLIATAPKDGTKILVKFMGGAYRDDTWYTGYYEQSINHYNKPKGWYFWVIPNPSGLQEVLMKANKPPKYWVQQPKLPPQPQRSPAGELCDYFETEGKT